MILEIYIYKMKYSSCYAKFLNMKTIIIVLFFSIVFSTVNSCYITNCPWGGKRSLSESQTSFHYVSKTILDKSHLNNCFSIFDSNIVVL